LILFIINPWNGKDARDAMKDPEHYYWSMYKILMKHKADRTSKKQIRKLLNNICKLLRSWHEVFHDLLTKQRESWMADELDTQIKEAVAMHRKLGLPITPKVHIMEDHGLEHEKSMPISFYFTIEEFVEQNHQTGHKYEEQVKRIKNADMRAMVKAERTWIEINPEVRRRIQAVSENGSRRPYKKRKIADATPSPFREEGWPDSPSWEECFSLSSDSGDEQSTIDPMQLFLSPERCHLALDGEENGDDDANE
jgi:hypothetical protein